MCFLKFGAVGIDQTDDGDFTLRESFVGTATFSMS
jgi:hypothetical protein